MSLQEIERFTVTRLEILDEEGNADESLDPDLSQDELQKMYRAMFYAREADQRMLKLQRQGRMGTFGLCTGQEACSIGAAFAMNREADWFVSSFRELGARLALGEPLDRYYLSYNGFEEGNVQPEDGNKRLLPSSVIVGAQTLHAVGLAFAMKYKKERSGVVVSFGDGATSQGDFHEALNFAAVWQAPVVFLCQNNQWAISVPRHKQTRSATIAQKAIGADVTAIQVDGNDVLAVYKATKDALQRAYAGEGPTLIEAVTYRLMMHTTADDPTKYRSPEEEQEWWKKEPLIRFRKYLEKKGCWSEADEKKLSEEIAESIEASVQVLEQAVERRADTPFEYVFGTDHQNIKDQHAMFLQESRKEQPHD